MSKLACKIAFDVDEATSGYLDSQSKIGNHLYNRLLEQANGLVRQYAESGGQDNQAAQSVYSQRGSVWCRCSRLSIRIIAPSTVAR
jgi:hypothetical protein